MKKRTIFATLFAFLFMGSLVAQKSDHPPAITVELSKMNVLYVGIDNPIKVSCEGLSSADYQVKSDKGTLTNIGVGSYNLNVSTPGEVILTVSIAGKVASFPFRAKRIPDPVPAFGAKYTRSDTMAIGTFKAQMGVALMLQNFDFDAKCDLIDYKIVHIGVNHENGVMFKHAVKNVGARFSPESQELISQAEPGDIYIFTDLKGRCPGDANDRKLNGLVFFLDDRK